MFRWVIDSSLQFRYVVLAAAFALVVYGSQQLSRMPVDIFPEFTPPIVEVQTEAIGLSADEVESLVTLGLEELLNGVPWLESTRSKSVTGLSVVTLIFKRGTDIIKARQMVQERLALAYTLPNVASAPVILQPLSAISRFMMIGISSDSIDPMSLSLLVRWSIKPRLLGVSGVANVAVWGQRLPQMHVQFDPDRLHDAKVAQDDVIAAVGDALWVSPLSFLKASSPGSGGWIDAANQRLSVEHYMPIEKPADMAKIPITVKGANGEGNRTFPLGTVADVTFDHMPLIGDALVNGESGLILVLEKFPSTGTREVTIGVERALEELRLGLPGVNIDTEVFRLENYVDDSINNLVWLFAVSSLLLVLVVTVFLLNWRSILISVLSMVISLAAAIAGLALSGATINTMILAGLVLALGVIIDDAVIDLKTLMARLRHQAGNGFASKVLILETSIETRSIALYSLLIVALAFMPIFFMGGVSGAFFEPLAYSFLLAVVASTVVALTVTPALESLLMSKAAHAGKDPHVMVLLRGPYERLVNRIIQRPGPVLVALVILVSLGLGLIPTLGESLIPKMHENQVLINWSTAPGTSRAETSRITSRVSRELKALPGVASVGALIGRAVTGDRIVGVNASQIWVSMDASSNHDETVAAIAEVIAGYPGIERSIQTYLRQKVGESLTGQTGEIVVRIFGPDRDVLHQQAEFVRQELLDVPGLADLRTNSTVEEPHVNVVVDLEKASEMGVKPGDVRRSSATVFSGLVVGYLFREQKIFEVVVLGNSRARASLSDLEDVWVEKSDRSNVRLADVADVRIESAPSVIRHENTAPYVDVIASVSGEDSVTVAEEVKERIRSLPFPLEYHPELLGEYAEWENAEDRIQGIVIVMLIGVFLLLQACFNSWRLAFVGSLAVLVSMMGGVIAIWMSTALLSLGSIVGFLTLVGIAARNSVLLINHFQYLETTEQMPFGLELVLRGARERMLPGLLSSIAVIAVLLPVLVLGQMPGLEIIKPIATVIIGGVIASALFTLLALPALYHRVRPGLKPTGTT